jgi:hypothetical protein
MSANPRITALKALSQAPLEQSLGRWWSGVDSATRNALLAAVVANVLAFGFEMTNLTLHHDDVSQIFIQDTILGYYLGRFGLGWLHYYTQNHYFMPFLQMAEGIALMSAYGVLVARFWGLRRGADIALVAITLCVFPYMAQIYQFNTAMAPYPAAHLLAACAVVLSVRATLPAVAIAALLYVAAFSIYQSVAANAATIFLFWWLRQLIDPAETFSSVKLLRSTLAFGAAAIAGGAIYLAAVSTMHIPYDAYQSADDAFHFREIADTGSALRELWKGTRSFLFWPEGYFPHYLKTLQLVIIGVAFGLGFALPKRLAAKAEAVALLVLALFAPRVLQLLHPEGHFATRTLTSYAVLIAGAMMMIFTGARVLVRNLSITAAAVLIAGYILQCNWISTVNYLNTTAHFMMLDQVLARLRAVPDANWDGKTVAVAGSYQMANEYPFKQNEAVASRFLDAEHMNMLARLMRDEARFVAVDRTMPRLVEYAATHAPWPAPGSVAILDGKGIVVFSRISVDSR